MDDAPSTDAAAPAPLDVRTSDPREIMRALLPAARAEYLKAWEFLADAATTLERRRIARDRATSIAADHSLVAAALREREKTLSGDELLNARHLASELERHVDALTRISTISPIGLVGSKELRPEALGCGRRYRDPSKPAPTPAAGPGAKPGGRPGGKQGGKPGGKPGGRPSGRPDAKSAEKTGAKPAPTGSRGVPNEPKNAERGKGRRPGGPGGDKWAKGPRRDGPVKGVSSGVTKHESQLGNDLDEETRAKLEQLRQQLEG